MYDPKTNKNVDWHDLSANEKLKHLIDENAWYVGEILAERGTETTHENNVAIARRFVEANYPELWHLVHGNFTTWPKPGALEKLVDKRTGFRLILRR